MLKVRTNPPFRVLYDLRWMELGRAGGVEQATNELISAISQLDRKNSYQVLAPRSACWEWDFPSRFKVKRLYSDIGEPMGERFHRFVAECKGAGPGGVPDSFSASAPRGKFDGFEFDLVHSTCSYINPELVGFPGILTIHDLQHLHHPEFFSRSDFDDRERLYRESAARARHIICISEFTRQDVHRQYGIPLEKMTTIWNIPSRSVWEEISARRRRALLEGMGVEGSFLFYPAQCWFHKNHARLVEAFDLVSRALPSDLKLVFAGRPFPKDHPAAILVRERGLGSRVVHLGHRSPLEIQVLFQETLALVFPSLFEGFGMPVAEAIIEGKPVVCSNVTSLPEIAGDAALFFDPLSVEEMGARIVDIATRPELRARLTGASRLRSTVYSAQTSAIRTIGVYERVFGEMSGAQP